MEGEMSKQEYQTVILAGLLHYVGKLVLKMERR